MKKLMSCVVLMAASVNVLAASIEQCNQIANISALVYSRKVEGVQQLQMNTFIQRMDISDKGKAVVERLVSAIYNEETFASVEAVRTHYYNECAAKIAMITVSQN